MPIGLDPYAPRTPLGHVKDAVLRAKLHVERGLDRASALHIEPRKRRAVIRELNFEFCGACNLRCTWCSLDSKLRAGFMDVALFEEVLRQIGDRELFDVRVINLHHSGDVLLHPKFRSFLDVLERERRERDDFPFVQLLTSATHLRGDRVDALLETDALDWLRFSVDGGNPRDFEAIRVGAKWDRVVGNIHAFLDEAQRRGRTIRTGIISLFATDDPEITPEFSELVARVTNYMPRLPHNWVGKAELGLDEDVQPPRGLCKFILSQTVVLHDGRVTLCCNDLNAEGVIGNLADRSLHEIFRGPERRAVIESMRREAALSGLRAATLAGRVALALTETMGRPHAPPAPEGPLRLLFLSQYPERFAGTKYRLGRWADRLRWAGHHVHLSVAVPSPHGERLANDWSVRARTEFHLRMLATRIPAALRARRYDAVVIHMNDLPFWEYGGPFVARALAARAGRVLLDLDDLPVMGGESAPRARALELVHAVDGLMLGTSDLLGEFRDAAAWVVPTCVEPNEWTVPDRSARKGPVVLGWVGSPGNARYLEKIAGPLAAVCRRHGARVRVVSSRPPSLPGVPADSLDFVEWSAEGEARDVAPMDIGLAPLADGRMERHKCGLKALQYMASGLPVVASPVGALARIVEDGATGVHAATDEEWERALSALVLGRDRRLRYGAAGRAAAESEWSFDVHQPRFLAALRGLSPDRERTL